MSETPHADEAADAKESGETLLLLRWSGDLTTKAPATRRRMTSRLLANLRAALADGGRRARLARDRNRAFVRLAPDPTGPDDREVARRLARVFGIQSVSVAHEGPWTSLEDVIELGRRFGSEPVRGRRFAVRARRVGERHRIPIRSRDVEHGLGDVLRPLSAGVDLSHPEVTVFVEMDAERAYVFVASEAGVGGLPLGTEGRAVSLISGGFDSPVASWRMLRRGLALDYVFCNLGGRPHQLETLAVAKRLAERWQCGTRPRFHALDFDPVSREIQDKVATRFWQLVLKRQMLRAGEAVADAIGASGLVTGEAIGQVSSQTLQNLSVISEGATLPILRPLIGHNKEEIIAESRRVGTHDLSARVGEYCAIVPSRPATHARLEDVLAEEAKMDPEPLARAIAERTAYALDEIDLEAWTDADLTARGLESGDVLIDLRAKSAYERWHHPAALFLDFPHALRAYEHFDRTRRYVLYCELGLKSAHLADLMRRSGLDARHVPGGVREVRRWVEGDRRGSGR